MKQHYEIVNKKRCWIMFMPMTLAIGVSFKKLTNKNGDEYRALSFIILSFEIRFYLWRTK